jgi:phage N-6-adenine-methyltransferase
MDTSTLTTMFSSASEEWATPGDFMEMLRRRFGPFDLDPAATPENAKAERYFTREDDGLKQSWEGRVFCNPPYGRGIGDWVAKGVQEVGALGAAERVVMLLPARTDTVWWHEYVMRFAHSVHFVRGRLKFGGCDNSAPFPSVVVTFLRQGNYDSPAFSVLERRR